MSMTPTKLKKYTANWLRYYDFRSGSLNDLFGIGTALTPTNVTLDMNGVSFPVSNSKLTAASNFLGASALTVIVKTKVNNSGGGNFGKIISANGDIYWQHETGLLRFYGDGASYASSGAGAVSFGYPHIFAVTRTGAGVTNQYVDGSLSGTANQSSGTPQSTAPSVIIGNLASNNWGGNIEWIVFLNIALTNSQINEISADIDDIKWPSLPSTQVYADVKVNPTEKGIIGCWDLKPINNKFIDKSLNGANLDIHNAWGKKDILGDCAQFDGVAGYAASTIEVPYRLYGVNNQLSLELWVRPNGAMSNTTLLAKGTEWTFQINHSTGTIRLVVRQSDAFFGQIVTSTLNGAVKSYVWNHLVALINVDTGILQIYLNAVLQDNATSTWNGTLYAGPSAVIYFGGTGSAYTNGDFLAPKIYNYILTPEKILNNYKEVARAIQFKTDWGVRESVAAESSGNLSNSPFRILTGTWKISTTTIQGNVVKVIECVTAGVIYVPISLFGCNLTDAAFGTWEWWQLKSGDGSGSIIVFISTQLASTYGYSVTYSSSETFTIDRYTGGSPTTILVGPVKGLNTWYKIKVTRSNTGVFNFYIDDTFIGTITDTNTMVSSYFPLAFAAGDKIAYADVAGNFAITKYLGVI